MSFSLYIKTLLPLACFFFTVIPFASAVASRYFTDSYFLCCLQIKSARLLDSMLFEVPFGYDQLFETCQLINLPCISSKTFQTHAQIFKDLIVRNSTLVGVEIRRYGAVHNAA